MPFVSNGCQLPTNAELHQLQMELFPQYLEGRVGLDILPFQTTENSMVVLRQPDIFKGKQAHRGLNKPTQQVPERYNPYGTFCEIHPGYWGEHDQLDEEIMTRWGAPGTCNAVFDATEYITWIQQRLLQRRAVLIEYNIWQTLVFGRYTALNAAGQVIHEAQFNIQNVSAGVPWTNLAGAFPLRDFRAVRLLGRGTSARFDSCAKAYMSLETANLLFANTNPNDVGRIGLSACCDFMSSDRINQQFAAQGLPQIVIYDGGWIDDQGVFNLFIPYGHVVIVGCRPNNEPVGKYWLTRNAVGCSITSGFWQKIVDDCDRAVPRKILIYDGHNGTPAIHYPRQIVVLRVI
jgi:hypothetical protein